MIRRELGIWRRLKHDNIVPLLGIAYGFGMQDAVSLVSSWMPNGTLASSLEKHDNELGVAHRLKLVRPQTLFSLLFSHRVRNCSCWTFPTGYITVRLYYRYLTLEEKLLAVHSRNIIHGDLYCVSWQGILTCSLSEPGTEQCAHRCRSHSAIGRLWLCFHSGEYSRCSELSRKVYNAIRRTSVGCTRTSSPR